MKYMETGEWGNYYVDQKVLQATDKWYAFSPTVGVQRKSYSDIQNGYMDGFRSLIESNSFVNSHFFLCLVYIQK